MIGRSKQRQVFIFLDTMPQAQGSGASIRFYSNVRAYLDLGFAVEVIQIANRDDGSKPSPDLTPVVWSRVLEEPPPSSLLGKLMFRAGVPQRSAVEYCRVLHPIVKRELDIRLKHSPDAIFHLEGEIMASVIPWIPTSTKAIWSLHDLPSTVSEAIIRVACEAETRSPTVSERREVRFFRRLERLMGDRAPLVLCIADYDVDRLRGEWGCKAVEYLPLSISNTGASESTNSWLSGGRLRLLHLGSVSHLPSYRSLEFLFEQVLPKAPPQLLERLSVDIVGRVDTDSNRTKRILRLAEPYTNISFHGYVEDVLPYYRNSDVQIVGSTDATGLRTRMIESFARGVPVLSTAVGARGIAHLKPGEDLIIANEPGEWVKQFEFLLNSPETLARLSANGRDFYRKNQSREAVAACLSNCLQRYFDI